MVIFLKGTETEYCDDSHVFFLNSHYTEGNASLSILEFLDMIRTNDLEKPYKTLLGQKAKARVQAVRSDKELEVSYMTFAQKMLDERSAGYAEGIRESILNLKEVLPPEVIAKHFKMPLEKVLKILGQS